MHWYLSTIYILVLEYFYFLLLLPPLHYICLITFVTNHFAVRINTKYKYYLYIITIINNYFVIILPAFYRKNAEYGNISINQSNFIHIATFK